MATKNSFTTLNASLMAIAWLAGFGGPLYADSTFRHVDLQSYAANWSSVAIIPTSANYYLGPPDLRLSKKKYGNLIEFWYHDSHEIYKGRFDDESSRIANDVNRLVTEAFRNRGFVTRLLEIPVVSEDSVKSLHSGFSAALITQRNTNFARSGDSKSAQGDDTAEPVAISQASRVATESSVDALVITRFHGWRKQGLTPPALGFTKSAVQLWIGLIDGQSGELVWIGDTSAASSIAASKQKTGKLDGMVNDALAPLAIRASAAGRTVE